MPEQLLRGVPTDELIIRDGELLASIITLENGKSSANA